MRTTQSDWLIERSFLTFSCCLKAGDTKRMGRVGDTHHDELPGYAASEHRGDAQRDDAGTAHKLLIQAIFRVPLEPTQEEKTVSEYLAVLRVGQRATYRHWPSGLGLA